MIKIEQGIPVPPQTGQGKGISSTLRMMMKGESVLLSTKAAQSWRPTANRLKIKIVTRTVAKGKIRIWRK